MTNKKHLTLLLIEDVDNDAELLLRHLRQAGYDLEYDRVQSADQMRSKIKQKKWDVIISDYSLPNFSGLEAFRILQESEQDIPFIVISGTIGEDTAVQAMKVGVSDYLMKDNLSRLAPAIERELIDAQNRQPRRRAEESLAESEERYRIVAETASDAIITIDKDSTIIFANPATENIFGYSIDEMVGSKLTMLMPERMKESHRRGMAQYLTTGNRTVDWNGIELPGRHKDGSERLLSISFGEYRSERHQSFTAIIRDITESKRAEEKLRESEEDFRGLVEATTMFVWSLNENGSISEFPEWWVDLTGQGYEDGKDFGWITHIHPDDRTVVKETFVRAIETKTPVVITLRIRDRDGIYRHYAARGVPLFNADGSFRKWICTLSDITERMSAEASLRVSEARFRELFENANDLIYTHDLEGNFTSLNRAGERITGYSRDEALQMNLRDVVAPEFLELAKSKVLEKIAGAGATSYDTEIITKDGRRVMLELSTRIVHHGDSAIGVQGIARDVTERHRIEIELRRNADQLRVITDSIPALISYFDTTLHCRFSNVQYLEWIGKNSEDVVDHHISDFLEPRAVKNLMPEFESALSGNAFSLEREACVERTDKEVDRPSFLRVSYVPDRDAAGEVAGFFVLDIDISDSKRAEEALRQSEEQLMQAQKLESIGRLAGGIAHDFNNMLTAINGYSDLALRRLEPNDPIRNNILEIRKAGTRSAELTNQLLAFSRRQMLQPQNLDVNEIIAETMEMLRRLIGENIDLQTIMASDVQRINADPGQLSQVLMNLVVNSRDAMPDGGTIVIETQNVELDGTSSAKPASVTPGKYVMLAVSDTGVGIDEETQSFIFEPFFTTKELGKGTGLGLSTVYGIVKQSGGNIWVYSEIGKGTSIKIYLPQAETETDIDAEIHSTPPHAPDLNFGSETILLVEDEEAVRNLSREMLNACGYNVIEAVNGVEALKIVEMNPTAIDLLMTDVMMPQMGGKELSERLLLLRPDIKVLFTSGYTDGAATRLGILNEATHFLAKPFTFNSLTKKIRELLDRE